MTASPSFDFEHLITAQFRFTSAGVDIRAGDSIRLELEGPEGNFEHDYAAGHLAVRQSTVGRGVSFSTVSGNTRSNFRIGSLQQRPLWARLWLPENYLASHSITTASGDVRAQNVACRALQIGTSSGNVALTSLRAEAMVVSTAGGDVTIDEMRVACPVEIETASGDVEIYEGYAPRWNIKTVGGGIRVRRTEGEIDPRTVHGAVDIAY